MQSISFAGTKFIWSTILCGVPQGNVLGLLLFILYTADVITIAQRHGFQVHSCAADTQLYFHDNAESYERWLPRFTKCIAAIESWMTAKLLKMTDYLVGLEAAASQNSLSAYCVRGSPYSCVICSHLSWGPVRQPTYSHPPRSGLCTSLFLPSSSPMVCEAVTDNRFSQDSGARTDSQSSRLLQQCVISDKHHRHKDPPVSFALSCTTRNEEAQVRLNNTDTSWRSSLAASSREDSFQALLDHLQALPSNRTRVPQGAVCSCHN